MQRLMSRLRWYGGRLASMSAREIAHRLTEQAKRGVSQFHQPDFHGMADAVPLPTLNGLAEGMRRIDTPALRDRCREVAATAGSQRFRFLGQDWPAVAAWPWHLDPVSGREWPRDRYCFRINYRHAADMGDVKYVWEVNRLQFLQPMAVLAYLEGDDALAERCLAILLDWIEANPPFRGVNWASGIELAVRVVSILIVLTLAGADRLSADDRRRIAACLAAHGWWLDRFPSRFSSANNHLVAEAAGLYLLGAAAPKLPGAAAWEAYGRRVLAAEAVAQIHPDGIGAEQSPTYTAFTLEWLLLCAWVGRQHDAPLPEAVWARLAAAGEALRWFLDEAGQPPRIGDEDEGRVVFVGSEETTYVPSVLAMIAAGLERPELSPPRHTVTLRDGLYGPPPTGQQSPVGVRDFAAGGYFVVRQPAHNRRLLLIVDHGPLGYLSIAAHGHADALAVWLHLDDRPILVDAGTYLYHSGAAWRDHFRGSTAHNTLVVDGTDQSRISGAFNWSAKATVHTGQVVTGPDDWAIEAEHDGYAKRFGIRHHRRVAAVAADAFRVEDRLIGLQAVRLPVEIGYLLHPDVEVLEDAEGCALRLDGRPAMHVAPTGDLRCSVERGLQEPPRAWYSPGFGARRPTSRIVYRGALATDERFQVDFRIADA